MVGERARLEKVFARVRRAGCLSQDSGTVSARDVNKDLTPKDQDKDPTDKDQDKDRDLTSKDQDKDLISKDKDLTPRPRTRTRT